MKTLATFAFLAVLTMGVSANANLRQEGLQNFFYYFGTPCSCMAAPTCAPAPCEAPCSLCNIFG